MGLLCFVLDLASLAPVLLSDLKRSLLHLENLCAVRRIDMPTSFSVGVAVCCIHRSSASEPYELRVIFKPSERLNVRDFHHAVCNLQSINASEADTSSSCGQVSCLGSILRSKDGLLSWGSQHSSKKIIMISSLFTESIASFRDVLLEAADRCITIDFIQVSTEGFDSSSTESGVVDMNRLPDLAVNIGEFENCTFQQVFWDAWQFASLEKQWFQDMVNDVEGPIEITLLFHHKLYKDTDRLFCSLRPLCIRFMDTIQQCQTCRCHGAILYTDFQGKTEITKRSCPYTGRELDDTELNSNSIKIGSQDVLHFPSFRSALEPASHLDRSRISSTFTVLKCINLSTLSEGLLFGDPYHLVPSSEFDLDDDVDNLEINDAVYSAVCEALDKKDCGLLCSSTLDINSRTNLSFLCYYMLLPAQQSRSFLTKRIVASEELLAISTPEVRNNAIQSELSDCVISCLSKIGIENYNPLNHDRGIHAKLNSLVKESIQFRPVSSKRSKFTGQKSISTYSYDEDANIGMEPIAQHSNGSSLHVHPKTSANHDIVGYGGSFCQVSRKLTNVKPPLMPWCPSPCPPFKSSNTEMPLLKSKGSNVESRPQKSSNRRVKKGNL